MSDDEKPWTAGPWAVETSSDKRTGTNVRTAHPVYDGATQGVRICRVTRVPGGRRCPSRMHANARLMAAAPQMAEIRCAGCAIPIGNPNESCPECRPAKSVIFGWSP